MIIDLSGYELLPIFLVSLGVILASIEIGCWLCVHAGGRGRQVASLEGAMLGLLALMIGFTFTVALTHFDQRRDELLNEANAIGTTALRARLLPAPHNTEALTLLREYVQVRLDITQRIPSASELAAAIDHSNAVQEALWRLAMAVAANDNGMVPTGLFIQTLNDMIDSQEKRLSALRYRVPNIVLIALYGVTAVAAAFAGYACGLEAPRSRLQAYVVGLVICSMILLIQDVDRPNAGFIKVSQQPMIDTAKSIAAYPD